MSLNNSSRRDFLRVGGFAALGAFGFRAAALAREKNRERSLYVGTYTSGQSEGIYTYGMNMDTGELRRIGSTKAVNPSFLALRVGYGIQRYLYAVNEVNDFAGQSSGALSAFALDSRKGSLNLLNQQASMGADPCHVTVDRTGRFA